MKMQLVIEAKFLLGDMTKKDMEERAALLVRWVMENNMFTNETPAKVAAWKVGFIRDGGEVDSVDGEIDMETFIEYHNQKWLEERRKTQMTLGEMIAALEALPPDAWAANLYGPHSYRGYYCDLEFKQDHGTRPAKYLLDECRQVLGATLEGWKGGEFVMNADTPVWIGYPGMCNNTKLLAILPDGTIETKVDDNTHG